MMCPMFSIDCYYLSDTRGGASDQESAVLMKVFCWHDKGWAGGFATSQILILEEREVLVQGRFDIIANSFNA